jgi:hypothetical protein
VQWRWFIEATLIIMSVALGFSLAQVGEARADRELAARALASLTAEVERNLAILEPLVPIHDRWVSKLADPTAVPEARSGIDVLFGTRPPLPDGTAPFPILRQSAWDAAVSGEAFRLIDYDLATTLSEIYSAQRLVGDNVDRLTAGALSATETYDPAHRAASVGLIWLTVADILAAERVLLARYEEHLPRIRAAIEPTR